MQTSSRKTHRPHMFQQDWNENPSRHMNAFLHSGVAMNIALLNGKIVDVNQEMEQLVSDGMFVCLFFLSPKINKVILLYITQTTTSRVHPAKIDCFILLS